VNKKKLFKKLEDCLLFWCRPQTICILGVDCVKVYVSDLLYEIHLQQLI